MNEKTKCTFLHNTRSCKKVHFSFFIHISMKEKKLSSLIINFSCSSLVLNSGLSEVFLCFCSDFIPQQFSGGILQLQLSIQIFTRVLPIR